MKKKTKRKVAKKAEVSYVVEITNDKTSTCVRDPNADDQWDRGDWSDDHNITGFRVRENGKGYFDLVLPYEPSYGEIYYLLYVIYSTGDSFGHTTNGGIEYIGLYTKDQVETARKNMHTIMESNAKKDKYSIKLLTPNGKKKFECYTPWEGYFESLSSVQIEVVHRLP